MLASWIPYPIKPVYEVANNYKSFPEVTAIEPNWMQNLPSEMRYTEYTSDWAISLGNTEIMKQFNFSPMKIDALFA